MCDGRPLCICGASVFTSCTSSDDNPSGPDADTPAVDPQVGAYVWGSTIYDMGADGAARLAEAYEKAGIRHAILLVKGDQGTVGYLNNSLSKAPLARTDRDILAETVSAMHKRGIKVYIRLFIQPQYDGQYNKRDISYQRADEYYQIAVVHSA